MKKKPDVENHQFQCIHAQFQDSGDGKKRNRHFLNGCKTGRGFRSQVIEINLIVLAINFTCNYS